VRQCRIVTPKNSPPLGVGSLQAQKTQLADAQGQRILWGWIPETRPEAEFSAAGWAGCMALPRVLSLGSSGMCSCKRCRKCMRCAQNPLSAKDLAPPFRILRSPPWTSKSKICTVKFCGARRPLDATLLWKIGVDLGGPSSLYPRDLLRPESPSMESPPGCLGRPIWNSTCSSTVEWPN